MRLTNRFLRVAQYICLSILFLIGPSVEKALAAAIVRFEATGKQFRNGLIYESKSIQAEVGLLGDFVELEDGEYAFTIDAPRNYRVRISLSVNDQIVQIVDSDAYIYVSDGCAEIWDISWDTPKLTTSKRQKITTIHLPDIRFIRNSGGGTCRYPSSIGCDRRKFVFSINSSPPNAEIWINGKKNRISHSCV